MTAAAEKVKELRAQKGWTQRELAARVKRSGGLIGQIESGRKPISAAMATALIKAFRLTGGSAAELRGLAALDRPTLEDRVSALEAVMEGRNLAAANSGFIDVVTEGVAERLRMDPKLVEELTNLRSRIED